MNLKTNENLFECANEEFGERESGTHSGTWTWGVVLLYASPSRKAFTILENPTRGLGRVVFSA
ncbi:hypothetical protein EPO05_06185 [Patescibacteria group bacterium]|nr:MAG: hypothetical protein EPO05_06185 [Patescibacteria group bacterium]